MLPSSTKDLIKIGNSKYAVVVAVAKRARKLWEENKNDENYRLSTMVTIALDEVTDGRIKINTSPGKPSGEET